MSWPTAGTVPHDVNALRTMLGLCNSWTSNGGAEGQVHYPDFAESTATYPAALIIRDQPEFTTYAAGAGALPSGSLQIEIFADETISKLEQIAAGIALELAAQQTGLPIASASAGQAQDITPGREATIDDATAVSYRGCSISITYRLGV